MGTAVGGTQIIHFWAVGAAIRRRGEAGGIRLRRPAAGVDPGQRAAGTADLPGQWMIACWPAGRGARVFLTRQQGM